MENKITKYFVSHRSGCDLCPSKIFDSYEKCIAYIEDELATFVRDYVYSEYGDESEEYEEIEDLTNEDVVLWGEEHDLICDKCFTGYGNWEEFDYNSVEITIPQERKLPKLDITEVVYELYKQDWLNSHTSPEERLITQKAYYEYLQECLEEGWDVQSFDEWIWESGYGEGSLYVCFDEFLDYEFQDEEYVKGLLGEKSTLWALYQNHMENEIEEELT